MLTVASEAMLPNLSVARTDTALNGLPATAVAGCVTKVNFAAAAAVIVNELDGGAHRP